MSSLAPADFTTGISRQSTPGSVFDGIEGESSGAFDASRAAETVVDVIRLRAAPVVFTPSARIGIGRTDGRTHQVPRQVRKRETEQEHHGCASQVSMPLTERDDFTVTPRLDERQILRETSRPRPLTAAAPLVHVMPRTSSLASCKAYGRLESATYIIPWEARSSPCARARRRRHRLLHGRAARASRGSHSRRARTPTGSEH